jgi:hypothetical protein
MKSLKIEHFTARPIAFFSDDVSLHTRPHAFTMEVFRVNDNENYLLLEWDIPTLVKIFHIGIWINGERQLIDFDGVPRLPTEAIELLEKLGYDCAYAR